MNTQDKITFQSFTERVAHRAKASDAEADKFIHQLFKTASDTLERGEEIQLYRFGRFTTVHLEKRPGTNPQTGEAITVPEHTRVDFQPYKALLIAVNWPFRNLRTKMLPNKEDNKRPSAMTWLIIIIVLAALVLIGINLSSRIFSRNSVTATATEETVPMESNQTTILSDPVFIARDADTVPAAAEETSPDISARATETAYKPATDTPVKAVAADNFVVSRGDTLWNIAASHWGDTSWWPVIYAENRPTLTARNPDWIKTGSSLRLPGLEGGVDQPTDADLRLKADAYQVVAEDYTALGHPRASEYRLFRQRGFDD